MSEIGEIYAAIREHDKDLRAVALVDNLQKVRETGLTVREYSEHHFLIGGRFDFWPSTEKFRDRKTQRYGQGIDEFLTLARAWRGETQ